MLLQADANPANTGFYVTMIYQPELKDNPAVKRVSKELRKAVKETTGRKIRTNLTYSESSQAAA